MIQKSNPNDLISNDNGWPVYKDKLSYEVRAFENDLFHVTKIEKPETELQMRLAISQNYHFSAEIQASPLYLENWLRCLDLDPNPEEIYFYLFRNKIGENSPRFYQKWLQFYTEKKEFIYAAQMLTLVSQNLKNIDFGAFKSFQNIEHLFIYNILDLEKALANSVRDSLCKDFYNQPFYQFHVNATEDEVEIRGFSYKEIGILESEFKELKKIDLQARIWGCSYQSPLKNQNFNFSNSNDGRNFSPPNKGRLQSRVKFDRIVNELISKSDVYINIETAEKIFPDYVMRAYEYGFLKFQYKNFLILNKKYVPDSKFDRRSLINTPDKENRQFGESDFFPYQCVSPIHRRKPCILDNSVNRPASSLETWKVSFSVSPSKQPDSYTSCITNESNNKKQEQYTSPFLLTDEERFEELEYPMVPQFMIPVFKKTTLEPRKLRNEEYELFEKFRTDDNQNNNELYWN